MHIKRIVIQGFKTYKNTTIIDDISPGHNVVVGRNGSGKSNFFAAIRFVLSDQYTRMSKEERQGLIHDGSGTILSAYVEIVFDNTDGRFAISKDEVIIRRTIGLKKDDYSLDHKSSTRTDIMQLLENAGFSKSNPYYIVPQGRINSLTNAKDFERLNLLKEVAGAKVFENKLKESEKEMQKTKSQRDKIDEMLKFIHERLADLDSEKDELKNFQELEKDKKIYEFILYDRELNECTTAIEEIDGDYQDAVGNSHQFIQELEKRENSISELNASIENIKHQIKILGIDEAEKTSLLQEIQRQIYEKSADLNEIKEHFDENKKSLSRNQKQLESIEIKLKNSEKDLEIRRPKIESLKLEERALESEISVLRTKQNILYSKQGRYSKFSSKEQRDNWITEQIEETQTYQANSSLAVSTLQDEISSQQNDLKQILEQVDDVQDSINGPTAQAEIQDLETKISDLRRKYAAENDERKYLWREETRSKAILDSLDEEVRQAERQVKQTMDRQQSSGLDSVKRITERLGLDGVYGPLGELISVNQKYRAAVEVVAGNSLFHVVVDSDQTASIIMDELVREKSGRVTFIPLNRINPKDVSYPSSSDCVPLIKKIGFDPEIQNAVKQVFGKTIVCVNLERGYELSREFKLNAITLDGDKADKKGVLTGGYQDFRKSRLESMKYKQDKNKEVFSQEKKLLEVKSSIAKKDQEILVINNEISKLSTEFETLLASKKPLKSKLSSILNDKFRIQDNIKLKEEKIVKIKETLTTLETKLEELNREKSSDFIEGLSNDEKNDLNGLIEQTSRLESKLNGISDLLISEESELGGIEIELNEVLRPRLQEILKNKSSTQLNEDLTIQELVEEIENLQEKYQSIDVSLAQLRSDYDTKKKELKKLQDSLDKADDQQRRLIKTLENYQRTSEKNLSRRSLLSKSRDDIQRKIRELGALPEQAFDNDFENKSSDQLLKKLNKVTKSLEKFSHVNRKALEQYLNFTKQRDGLVERRKELDNSEESIDELISVLISRKEDAIQNTFSQVSKAFSEVFEKLVPKGIGKLVMQTRSAESQIARDALDEDLDEDEQEALDGEETDNYTGISIQVSFNSKNDEQQKIEQLSGGQKSLCAIALILAIQKSDPAPFYLFDEIDANLDAQYRTAVANLIHELSSDAQFICTTFRPEMLQVANKFFGVMFNNKISTVSEIVKSDALGFVEGQQQRS
ncbi:hypothetical protein WICMUC_000965 [Wickerhamomyces mucosus]|uniref:Structural maintenance of chromosomes protein n=1 Tax=Wickerhamomyces mucosus TaxID=1378264 RepID=A0A9P8TI42_9ASCO|nr:hypothetical protein WICMUC_000965 [Wickerhamomyces mucosus]